VRLFNLKLMKGALKMKRRILIIVFMLLSVAALTINNQTVCAFGFCEQCDSDSVDYAYGVEDSCLASGGSTTYCRKQFWQSYCMQLTMFCYGCERPIQCGPIN
jgi:hypothetical protein